MDWSKFEPTDFEYDFQRDELFAHRITFKEAVECFYNDFEIRRNKSFKDRFQLIGETFGGRKLKIIFQLKPDRHCADNYRLGFMNENLTEKEIDELVIAEANDDDAWEKPISVNRKKNVFFEFFAVLRDCQRKRDFERNARFSRNSRSGFGFD